MFAGVVRDSTTGFWERLESFIYSVDLNIFPVASGQEELDLMKKHMPDLPPIAQLVQKITYMFCELAVVGV